MRLLGLVRALITTSGGHVVIGATVATVAVAGTLVVTIPGVLPSSSGVTHFSGHAATGSPTAGARLGSNSAAVPGDHTLTITASTEGTTADGSAVSPFPLYPGARAKLLVVVTNRGEGAVNVTSFGVTVGDANPRCPGRNLLTSAVPVPFNVGSNSSIALSVPLSLSPDAPDACKDASFPLALAGIGSQAAG